MTQLAVWSGMHPRAVGALDADEYDALVGAVKERRQAAEWGNLHEAVAAAVEALWMILSRLEAGVPTIEVAKAREPQDRGNYPRPEWVDLTERPEHEDADVVVTTSLREAILMMRRGGAA